MLSFLIHLPVIGVLLWHWHKRMADAPLQPLFWVGVGFKLLAGVAYGGLYLYYYPYTGDTFTYFGDAAQLSQFAWERPADYVNMLFFNEMRQETALPPLQLWEQPRAFFMAKLLSIVNLFTLNNYWMSGAYLSLFSFYGCWRLANILTTIFPATKLAAGLAFLLFPSVVFWSAGVTKESVVMGCLGWSVSLVLAHRFKVAGAKNPFITAIILALSAWLLWQLKYYYLGVLLPALLAYVLTSEIFTRSRKFTNLILPLMTFLLIFIGTLAGATRLHPNLHPDRLLPALVVNHNETVLSSVPEDLIQFNQLQPTVKSLLGNLPNALFSGLFRPLVWEARTVFQAWVGLENLALLIVMLFSLRLQPFRAISGDPRVYLLLVSAGVYIVLLATLLAFSSPNFGALSRYKVGFLPFLVYILFSRQFTVHSPRIADKSPKTSNKMY